METSLLMPREVTLDFVTIRKPKHRRGTTGSTRSLSSDGEAAAAEDESMSSLANSGLMGDAGLESGFESFADFLAYTSQLPTQEEGRWRRRRKFLAVRRLKALMKKATQALKRAWYGLCRIVVFSAVNVAVAFSFLFFLIS